MTTHTSSSHNVDSSYDIRTQKCPICLKDIIYRKDAMLTTSCGHVFHAKCLKQWHITKPDIDCPICRKNIVNDDMTSPSFSAVVTPPRPSQLNRHYFRPIYTIHSPTNIYLNNTSTLEEIQEHIHDIVGQIRPSEEIVHQNNVVTEVKNPIDTSYEIGCIQRYNNNTALFDITVESSVSHLTRQHVHLVVCIDISGSMNGYPMTLVKETLGWMVSQLQPEDVLTLITFNSDVKVLLNNYKIGSTDSYHVVTQLITTITASGSTNLCDGLLTSITLANNRHDASTNVGIILLTDGDPTMSIQSPARIEELIRHFNHTDNVPIFTIGVGSEYNATLLSMISNTTGGVFDFVDKPEKIPSAFSCSMTSIVGINCEHIECVLTPFTGTNFNVLGHNSDSNIIHLKNNMYGEHKYILATFSRTNSSETLGHLQVKAICKGVVIEHVFPLTLTQPTDSDLHMIDENMNRIKVGKLLTSIRTETEKIQTLSGEEKVKYKEKIITMIKQNITTLERCISASSTTTSMLIDVLKLHLQNLYNMNAYNTNDIACGLISSQSAMMARRTTSYTQHI